jgi:acetyl esterase/lipase
MLVVWVIVKTAWQHVAMRRPVRKSWTLWTSLLVAVSRHYVTKDEQKNQKAVSPASKHPVDEVSPNTYNVLSEREMATINRLRRQINQLNSSDRSSGRAVAKRIRSENRDLPRDLTVHIDDAIRIPRVDSRLPKGLFDDCPLLFGQCLPGAGKWLAEAGSQLPAEWLWTDQSAAAYSDGPTGSPPKRPLTILSVHGGAFFLMSPRSHRGVHARSAANLNANILAIDYRLAPEHTYPAPILDTLSAYIYLTVDKRIPASQVVLLGDSAGGNIVMAFLLFLRQFGSQLEQSLQLPSGSLVMPKAAILHSPFVS